MTDSTPAPVILDHAEALALLMWLRELHLQVPAAADPALHAALAKLHAAQRPDEAELLEGAGRVYELADQDKITLLDD